ncbi:hypothetical protein [Chondromyces crocatus]|uniref:Secreted protein n=1 Tax=Chondromyces crocatus TaxID=52 RepID=A0A0K1E6G3_CHOCO|nr:hypothetical protein [Chondromyces crocatus]AKT36465.1 uncharacterized protein CMC5_005800 [Chondromyces crocatus]
MNWKQFAAWGTVALSAGFSMTACAVGTGEGVEAGEVAQDALEEFGEQFCGGIANMPCPDGFACVDDPHDDCDPRRGGYDCGGICVPESDENTPPGAQEACSYDEEDKNYVLRDPQTCMAALFRCPDGQDAFFDHCGCGCLVE